MPLTITSLNILNEYINGVMNRADHHAHNVNEVILSLAGAVIWRSTTDIEVKTYQGETANILWLTIENRKYALAFNHNTGRIEIRERTIRGQVLHEFDNSSSNHDVKRIFESL